VRICGRIQADDDNLFITIFYLLNKNYYFEFEGLLLGTTKKSMRYT
jgi:hypothetical protein